MINILAIYDKFLLIRPNEILSIKLSSNLKSLIVLLISSNIIYLYFLYVTTRAKPHQKKADIPKHYINVYLLKILSKSFKF